MQLNEKRLEKVVCPFCGYQMPVFQGENAQSKDIYIKCKGRKCGQWFEIKINRTK